MRHVFILNPVAGKKHRALKLREDLKELFAASPETEYTVRITEGVGDATRIAAEECAVGDAVRLYACGGDGTLMETANGIPAGSDAQLTVIPCGSGNDYVRTFGDAAEFFNLPELVNGRAVPVDAIDCDGRRSLNIASLGMDAKVAAKMNKFKKWPGVSGSMAYKLAILDVLLHPLGDELQVEIETENGVEKRTGSFLLALAASGQFYGGGFHGAPQAVEDDGLLDFVLIRKISRLKIPRFLGKYKAGDYLDLPFCEALRGRRMTISAAAPAYCNTDGECICDNRMSFSVVPGAYRFVLPGTLARLRDAARTVILGGAHEATAIGL